MYLPGRRRESPPILPIPEQNLDSEPWHEQGAVDALLGLQARAFQVSTSANPVAQEQLGDIYGQMATVEAGIRHHSEEVGYLYSAIEAFELGKLTEKTIAAHCLIARARFEMRMPELGYSAYKDALRTHSEASAAVRADLAKIDDEVMIELYTPKRVESFHDRDNLLASVQSSIQNADYNAFARWLSKTGSKDVAQTLRQYAEAQTTGNRLTPLIDVLGKLLARHVFPKGLHEQVIVDLDELRKAGPLTNYMGGLMTLLSLQQADNLLLIQPKLSKKHRKHVRNRKDWYDATVGHFASANHFGGIKGSVPAPINAPSDLIAEFVRKFGYLYPDSNIEAAVHKNRY